MAEKSQFEGLLADKAIVDELRRKANAGSMLKVRGLTPPRPAGEEIFEVAGNFGNEGVELPPGVDLPLGQEGQEAIILEFGRPVLLVRRDTFEVPESDEWKDRLYPNKSKLEHVIRSVGRVELQDHDFLDWAGTAWMVSEDVAVTNRHVGMIFARKQGAKVVFRTNLEGMTIRARVDFKVEYKENATQEIEVEEVIYLADDQEDTPDIALLRLRKGNGIVLPPPLVLSRKKPTVGGYVATIGYPARDSRSDVAQMVRIFGDIYNVKRLAPGTLTSFGDSFFLTHDCSTLGGNSGSVVVDVESGEVLGLHFGGTAGKANYAVKAEVLLDLLKQNKVKAAVSTIVPAPGPAEGEDEAPALTAADYADRTGYDPTFLRTAPDADHQDVPLPTLPDELLEKAVRIQPGNGGQKTIEDCELKYNHFSVFIDGERRMAFFTVVNVDGQSLKWIPRSGDRWLLDPRLPKARQAGNELYRNNDLDKGHLVRRLDPVWGELAEARKSNDDTFHYTNASPQHKDLNQKTWNDLEDYILDNAGANQLKVTVFTGPVFADDDPEYRTFHLPRQFWKVVAMVKDDGKMSATAYILSQQDLLSDLEFAFGQFRTYQVPVAQIEGLTSLNFGNLRDFDPLGQEEAVPIRIINRPEDILI